jgi:hypothetical protein
MGHLAGKELYKKLQSKLDGYTVRTPGIRPYMICEAALYRG